MSEPMRVTIIGLGCRDNEECVFCLDKATIYIDVGDMELTPACNNCVGPGALGEYAVVTNPNIPPWLAEVDNRKGS